MITAKNLKSKYFHHWRLTSDKTDSTNLTCREKKIEKKYMLGASEFSKHISYVTYNILYKYNNDLLKASKHALVEVALQRKNIIPFLLRKPLPK